MNLKYLDIVLWFTQNIEIDTISQISYSLTQGA